MAPSGPEGSTLSISLLCEADDRAGHYRNRTSPPVARARARTREGTSSASMWTGTRVPRNTGFPPMILSINRSLVGARVERPGAGDVPVLKIIKENQTGEVDGHACGAPSPSAAADAGAAATPRLSRPGPETHRAGLKGEGKGGAQPVRG